MTQSGLRGLEQFPQSEGCLCVVWVWGLDDAKDFADAIFQLLTRFLFSLKFFLGFLFGAKDGSKEGCFLILRHCTALLGLKVLRSSPGFLTVSFSYFQGRVQL